MYSNIRSKVISLPFHLLIPNHTPSMRFVTQKERERAGMQVLRYARTAGIWLRSPRTSRVSRSGHSVQFSTNFWRLTVGSGLTSPVALIATPNLADAWRSCDSAYFGGMGTRTLQRR